MQFSKLMIVLLMFVPFPALAQPNPYCVTGFDWRATNSRMVKLNMPGGLNDASGSLGYIWGQFSSWNIPAMTNPCYRLNQDYCYEVDTGTIRNMASVEAWILANPGKVYLIGNEPDNPDLAAGDGMTPQSYATMYHRYHSFITPLDPTARIAVAGLAGSADTASLNADIAWWNQSLTYYKNTYGEDMPIDVWNIHCYSPVGRLDPDYSINKYLIPFRAYVDTVSGGIYADKPIWLTEFGVAMWATQLAPKWQAEFIQQLCPRLEKEYELPTGQTKRVVDRFFWFLGSWENAWRDSALLDQQNLPTMVGEAYSTLANNYPNPIPTREPPPAPPLDPITVDFESTPLPWEPMSGDWLLDAGTYRQTRMEGAFGLRTTLPYWYKDLRITADVRVNAANVPENWVGINLRGGTIWEGSQMRGYLVILRQNGELGLFNAIDGTVASVPDAVADTSIFHQLSVTVSGWDIEVKVDGQTLITWTDNNQRISAGLTSLEAGLTNCSYDNVTVTKICADDVDGDVVCADEDNCPTTSNPGQEDGDHDGLGDACDNCPENDDPDQTDSDSDGLGDVCDPDDDGDEVDDIDDNCHWVANATQEDSDADGVGDACDACPTTVPGADVDAQGCPQYIPGDLDRDGDVDMEDFGRFQMCYTGQGVVQTLPACADANIDGDDDDDVDNVDFGFFQACISGANIPANPNCAP